MTISDHNITETAIKAEDRNKDMMADKMNEYDSK
jgi:hypothetical protein